METSALPVATVSVDVDPLDVHLVGYGVRGLPPDPLVYERAIPRLLECFDRARIRATWFFVARDSRTQRAAIAAVAAAGHETASHSLTHPEALNQLPADDLVREVRDSKHRLEDASGAAVRGFRAPSWNLEARAAATLVEAGYRYDASAYPSPFLLASRLLLAYKSRSLRPLRTQRLWPASLAREPHAWRIGGGSLQEFPLSVSRVLRFPVYHTARYVLSESRFVAILAGIAAANGALSYPLHAVDALGLAEDRVDPRLASHPGMDRPLAAKLSLLSGTLSQIGNRFAFRPFAERIANS